MPDPVDQFIARWEASGAAEKANYALFLTELCDLLDVPRPDPTSPDPAKNRYVFERAVTRVAPDGTSSSGFIDLYKAGHFVLETKQGANDPLTTGLTEAGYSDPGSKAKTGHGKRGSAAFDRALERAYHQARGYITSLPSADGRPPFLIVCDVGHSLDLYAEFTGTGGHYERFPDPRSHRITLADLRRPEIRERLRLVWTDPHSLDPSKKAAEVTRDIADRLARLAKSLEGDGHDPQTIAGFLQRCLFTMFAEDVGLLPEDAFHDLLAKLDGSPQGFPVLIGQLWKEMATGTSYSTLLFREIAHFNGGLFEDTTALPLSKSQLAMLVDASRTDWSQVEPSIFGTLVTRALDPRERHKLGAHYTPRSYVERLVRPTIIDPLREEWDAVRIAAASLHREADQLDDEADAGEEKAKVLLAAGKSDAAKKTGAAANKLRAEAKKKDAEALKLVTGFHRSLCQLRILDPACGTANFLYVTLELLKRLEAEVLELLTALGGDATFEMEGHKIRPQQFLGIEISNSAAKIAELVLWIGYFQWQRKTTGKADTNDRPLLPRDKPIECRDAVLAYEEKIPRRDPETGAVVQIWDGHSTKPHPVTGKEVPDESARIVVYDYVNPRRAEWPEADYIVGNPPFIGASRMREALGDGYTEALRKAWKGSVPESADFVMNWWAQAAELVAKGKVKRFGFITTNSIHQTFNRRVLEPFLADAKRPLHLGYAIPDHPWVDSADGAAVRIAMTVAAGGKKEGLLEKVVGEVTQEGGENDVTLLGRAGVIAANLQVGADLTATTELLSNLNISSRGHELGSAGFIVTKEQAQSLGLGRVPGIESVIRPYVNGRDLTERSRGVMLIDAHGLDEETLRSQFPEVYQHLQNAVLPERKTNRDPRLARFWWLHRRSREELRSMARDLNRFIATVETSKHRVFAFLDKSIVPDNKLIVTAHSDAYVIAVLSSQIHVTWSLATGSRLEDRPVYVKTTCFETFPFPALEEGPLKSQLRELGERLDGHRKRQQALHPHLTLTGIYNVLEKLRAGEALNAKEKQIHDDGLVTLLRQIHDEIDAAVLSAYGWDDLRSADTLVRNPEAFEEELLTRLVALNHERAAEEKRGLVRWLRPEYQNPAAANAAPVKEQSEIELPEAGKSAPAPVSTLPWPDKLPEQVARIRSLLPETGPHPAALSARFGRANKKREDQIAAILETLRGLGL
ncbi:MAG: class I SAM-dependent DNA methyltransferase [Verrucomicrobiales bacterium]|nr:class I SAM-dependent DNA methyltransferase [Verrucomicrobiales bacterium]